MMSHLAIFIGIFALVQIGIAVGTYYYNADSENTRVRTQLESMVSQTMDETLNVIDIFKYNLERTANLFEIYEGLVPYDVYYSNMQFANLKNFALLNNNAEIFLWTKKVLLSEKSGFQNFMTKTIKHPYFLYDIIPTPPYVILSPSRPVYWPVTYYTLTANTTIEYNSFMGFDLASTNSTNIFVHDVLSTSNITVTQRSKLLSDPNPNNYGVWVNRLAFINGSDLFNNDNNNNQILTPDDVYGFASIVVKIGQFFTMALSNINFVIDRNDVDIFVFDITNDSYANINANNISILYKETDEAYKDIWFSTDVEDSYDIVKYNYTFINRNWQVCFKFSKNFIASLQTPNTLAILLIVVLGSFLIDIIIIMVYKSFLNIKTKADQEERGKKIATQMLSYVNHEVRNPLNVIKGLVGYTLDSLYKIDSEGNAVYNSEHSLNHNSEHSLNHSLEQNINIPNITIQIHQIEISTLISDLTTVSSSCDLLEHIVTDILDIKKLESNKLDIINQVVNVGEFLTDITKIVSQKVDEKQTLQIIHDYDNSMVVFIDPYRLKQILLNFLTNSIKYTITGSITVSVKKNNTSTQFAVIDTGKGIADNARVQLFEPYNQNNSDDASRYGGVGLGLYLCKMLVERMNGRIDYTSVYGKGSTFWIEFDNSILQPPVDV